MIDFGSGVPVWRQVTDSLRERLARGDWAPGVSLPREVDLAHEYEVGLDTVRKAMAALRAEGLLLPGGPGRRSRVPPAVEHEHVRLPRGSTMLVRMPTPTERAELGLPEGVPLAEVRFGGRVLLYPGDRHDFSFS